MLCAALSLSLLSLVHSYALSYVPGFHADRHLSPTGLYEKHIDTVDVFGGYTFLDSRVQLNQDRFVTVDAAAFVSCSKDSVVLHKALAPAAQFGAILAGGALESCCDAAINEASMQIALCAKEVVSSSSTQDRIVYKVRDLDPQDILESAVIKFYHKPGNLTLEQAKANMRKANVRKRDEPWVEANYKRQLDAFSWNYNGAKAQKEFNIYSPYTALGFQTKCINCYIDLSFDISFELVILKTRWYKLPSVQFVKLVFGGELNLGNVIETTFPVTVTPIEFVKDLMRPIEGRALYVPAGILSFTIQPAFVPEFVAGFAVEAPVTIRRGSTNKYTVKIGFQWSDTRGARKIWSFQTSTQTASGVTVATEKAKGQVAVGLALVLEAKLGVSLTALAASGDGGVQFLVAGIGLHGRGLVEFAYNNKLKCNAIGAKLEVKLETEISAIILEVGPFETKIGVAGGLPKGFGWTVWEKECTACAKCLTGRKREEEEDEPMELVEDLFVTDTFSSAEDATSASVSSTFDFSDVHRLKIEAPYKLILGRDDEEVRWEVNDFVAGYGGQGGRVGMVIQTRDLSDEYKIKTFYLPETPTASALDGYMNFAMPMLPDASILRNSQVRVLVYAEGDDRVFGESEWKTLAIHDGFKKRQLEDEGTSLTYSGWSACSSPCGPDSRQTREAFCVDSLTSQLTSGCVINQPLGRYCDLPDCKFVPFQFKRILNENDEETVKSPFPGSVINVPASGRIEIAQQVGGGIYPEMTVVQLCGGCGSQEECVDVDTIAYHTGETHGMFRTVHKEVDLRAMHRGRNVLALRFKGVAAQFTSYSKPFYIIKDGATEEDFANMLPPCADDGAGDASSGLDGVFRDNKGLLEASASTPWPATLVALAALVMSVL